MDKRVTVKWKYKDVKPGQKNHTIDNYIKYITDQVKNRREGSGLFELQDNTRTIGNAEHDEKILKKDWDQKKYIEYAENRKGSNGLISDEFADSEVLKNELLKHEGPVWIPIVSTKEQTAITYGLDTEIKWEQKARELAESYRKTLGIDKDNYRWLAAFHVKPEPDQNKDADAGSMPHLHFMIWEDKPQRARPTLLRNEINNVRIKTATILSHEYIQGMFEERNNLRTEIKTSALDLNDYIAEVDNLIIDIRLVTKGKGKMTLGEFEKKQQLLLSITDKFKSDKPFTQYELNTIEQMNIKDEKDANKMFKRYSYIVDELNELCEEAVKRPEVQELLDAWRDISNEMRAAQNDLAKETTDKDEAELKRQIMNGILKQAKEADNINWKIPDKAKGMLIERIQQGKIYSSDPMHVLETTTQFLKELGYSQEENKELNNKLLDKSGLDTYKDQLNELVEAIYANVDIGVDMTTKEFYEVLKELRVPIGRFNSKFRRNYDYYPEIANTVINQPVAKLIKDQSPNILSPFQVDILTNVLDKAQEPTFSMDSYADAYRNLLETLSDVGQIDDEYERQR